MRNSSDKTKKHWSKLDADLHCQKEHVSDTAAAAEVCTLTASSGTGISGLRSSSVIILVSQKNKMSARYVYTLNKMYKVLWRPGSWVPIG
jgi:hypothetical protein